MGAGNRYTLKEDGNELCCYVDTSCDCWEHDIYECDCYENQLDILKSIIETLPLFARYGWDDSRNSCYYGEMYKISLVSGNHNEIVIDLEYQDDFEYYGLQQYNYVKTYARIVRHINKHIALYIGHGWTSSHYAIGEL